MKKLFYITIFIALSGCLPTDDLEPEPTTTTQSTNGKYIFWIRTDLGVGNISAYLNGSYVGEINTYYTNGVNCESDYNLSVTQQAGTYTFKGVGADGTTWERSVTFTAGGCQTLELTNTNTGGGGGGGGGNSGNGKYVYWVRGNLGVGQISLYYDNTYEGRITKFYSSGLTDCTGDPNLTIQKADGSYSWRAVGEDGTYWRGSALHSQNSCRLRELTSSNKESCLYHLDGTWVRQNDGPSPGTTGMVITYSNGQGVIQSVGANAAGFAAGQIKWKELDNSNCFIRDLENTSTMYYNYHDVQVTDADNIVINGNSSDPNLRIRYKKQ